MKEVNCNLCGADNWTVRIPATLNVNLPEVKAFRCTSPDYGKHAQVVTCQECGHVYCNPTWDADELVAAYAAVEDSTYVDEREGRELSFRKHLESLEQITGPAAGRTLLDVGAYIGVFVEVAKAAGWKASGVDPSAWAAAEASKRGIQVVEGTLDSPALQGKQFDVITIYDVIEHLDDPKGELQKAFELLAPGGTIAVHTMDIDSWAAKLMGRRWPWFMGMHVQYFSQRTLAKMMTDCGYQIIASGAHGRYLRLGYVATRVTALNRLLGALFSAPVRWLKLESMAIPINFGDLFTVFANRPVDP